MSWYSQDEVTTPKSLKPILLELLDTIIKNMDSAQLLHIVFFNGDKSYRCKFFTCSNNLEIGLVSDEKYKYCLLYLLDKIINNKLDDIAKRPIFIDYGSQKWYIEDLIDFYSGYYETLNEINYIEIVRILSFSLNKINDIELWSVFSIKKYIEEHYV